MNCLRLAVGVVAFVGLLDGPVSAAQGTAQDVDKILERADKFLDEARSAYEEAREKGTTAAFADAGLKLQEARIRYTVVQEIGSPELQRTATDRLRAVNQLGKVIGEGKATILGSRTDPSAPAARPQTDVTKRLPIPDLVKQRNAEKLILEVFKPQYSRKTSADRKALARLLLDQVPKSQEDAPALWVLFRDAQENAAQAGDVGTAIEAVDWAAQIFDIDAMAIKAAVLTAVSKVAKTPGEFSVLVQALLSLAQDQVNADQFEAADNTAALALQIVRSANDPALSVRTANLAKELAEAKSLFKAMKGVLEALARKPDDPGANLEMGQFLCFVKGDWDVGAWHLSKGSDTFLKSLADRELALPDSSADRVALADDWSDFAEREKNAFRKSRILAHSRVLYEAALPAATGLLATKIEKRLKELGVTRVPIPIDLFSLVNLQEDKIKGDWSLSKDGLTCTPATFSRLQVPYSPPEEYDLTLIVERTGKDIALILGVMLAGDARCQIIVDWDGISGVDRIDGKNAKSNETTHSGPVLRQGHPTTLLVSVRRDGLSLTAEGKLIFSWKGVLNRLSFNDEYAMSNPKAMMLAWHAGGFRVKKMELLPISGSGKRLR